MSFNFGKENVSEGGNGVAIFNNGDAGRVEGISLNIEKKGVDYQDEGKNKPDYQVVFTDAAGAFTRDGYYYLNEKTHNAAYGTFEKAVEKQWNKLASIVVAAGGDPSISQCDATQMLDQMVVKAKSSVVGKTFNTFANYGTKQNPKKYLQIRSWAPFIESGDVTVETSKLKTSNLDQIERIVADAGGSSSASAGFSTDGWV